MKNPGSHYFCFGRNKPMRAHVWTRNRMHQSAIVLVRCVTGSFSYRRFWGRGCAVLGRQARSQSPCARNSGIINFQRDFSRDFRFHGAYVAWFTWRLEIKGRARTATGSKYTLPGMRMRTLESSLCRPRLVADVISPVFPSYRKREYFALLCLDKCSNRPYF